MFAVALAIKFICHFVWPVLATSFALAKPYKLYQYSSISYIRLSLENSGRVVGMLLPDYDLCDMFIVLYCCFVRALVSLLDLWAKSYKIACECMVYDSVYKFNYNKVRSGRKQEILERHMLI